MARYNPYREDSIVRIVFIFILYTFVVVVTYFFLSAPMGSLLDAFDDADFNNAETYLDNYMPTFRQAFTLAMAILLAIPITWFVMKIFSKEPAYYTYRR